VWPKDLKNGDVLARLTALFAEKGVRLLLWPMLDDADGRWLNASNAERFAAFVRRLERHLTGGLAGVLFDLEPPLLAVRSPLPGDLRALAPRAERRREFEASATAIRGLVSELEARNVRTSAAVLPVVLFGPGWEELLGTPVRGMGFDHVTVMMYTSILEGWS